MSGKRRGNVEKPRKYRKGLKADYRGATPEQVALALHRYRPEQGRGDDGRVQGKGRVAGRTGRP